MKWRQVMLWTALSVVYLLLFEGAVRLFWPQNKVTEHLAGASLGEKDPRLGHRLRANAHTLTRTAEFDVEYRTNADGWRDAERFDRERKPGTPRLLLLGDSFAFGEGVDYEASFAVLLEKAWREDGPIEVIKAGVPGFDTRREVLLLETLLGDYQPDAVLILFVPNDLFTNERITPSENIEDRSLGDDVDVINVRQEKKKRSRLQSLSLLRRWILEIDPLYVRLYTETGRGRFFAAEPDAEVEEQLRITGELFRQAQALCQEYGTALAVASLPQQFQVLLAQRADAYPALDAHEIDRRLASEFVGSNGAFAWWPLLDDLAEVYRQTGTPLFYRLDGHLNSAGHDALASILIRKFGHWAAFPPAEAIRP